MRAKNYLIVNMVRRIMHLKNNLKEIWKYTDLKKMLGKTSGVIQIIVLKNRMKHLKSLSRNAKKDLLDDSEDDEIDSESESND